MTLEKEKCKETFFFNKYDVESEEYLPGISTAHTS